MAGDEATVAKHSLLKQDWLCQDFILVVLSCVDDSLLAAISRLIHFS